MSELIYDSILAVQLGYRLRENEGLTFNKIKNDPVLVLKGNVEIDQLTDEDLSLPDLLDQSMSDEVKFATIEKLRQEKITSIVNRIKEKIE